MFGKKKRKSDIDSVNLEKDQTNHTEVYPASQPTINNLDFDDFDFENRIASSCIFDNEPTKNSWRTTKVKLDEIKGQDEVVTKLQTIIKRASENYTCVDSVLLHGGSAKKRLEIAEAFAEEIAENSVQEVLGDLIEKEGDMAEILTSLREKDVLIVSEVQKIKKNVLEILVQAISSCKYFITIGKGSTARKIELPIPKATYICLADYDDGRLDCIDYSFKLSNSNYDDSVEFIQTFLEEERLTATPETVEELSKAGLTTVQLRRKLVELRDIAFEKGETVIDHTWLNNIVDYSIEYVDNILDGLAFEKFAGNLLSANGFNDVEVTKASGDFGVDIIAYKDDIKYAFQCKKYSSPVGIDAVQEVLGSKTMFDCHVGVVLTNNFFTLEAVKLAEKNHILLWDRNKLISLMAQQS